MPLFMDVHNLEVGLAASEVCNAHLADLQTQDKYDVSYLRYWVDEGQGKIFCLVEAPSADAANTVHRNAHGLVADQIYQVQEGAGGPAAAAPWVRWPPRRRCSAPSSWRPRPRPRRSHWPR